MAREQKKVFLHFEENLRRRFLLIFLVTSGISWSLPSYGKTKAKNPYDERRLLEQNKRIQRENNAPDDFPNFVREGSFSVLKLFFLGFFFLWILFDYFPLKAVVQRLNFHSALVSFCSVFLILETF